MGSTKILFLQFILKIDFIIISSMGGSGDMDALENIRECQRKYHEEILQTIHQYQNEYSELKKVFTPIGSHGYVECDGEHLYWHDTKAFAQYRDILRVTGDYQLMRPHSRFDAWVCRMMELNIIPKDDACITHIKTGHPNPRARENIEFFKKYIHAKCCGLMK